MSQPPPRRRRSRNASLLFSSSGPVLRYLSQLLHWFEVLLAGISVVFVIVGILFLVQELFQFSGILAEVGLQTGFEDVLADILLLVVGVELGIMLVRRTPESLVEVMFFVIARKMLLKTGTFVELLLGVAALAGLFAIRKYLEHAPPARQRLDDRSTEELVQMSFVLKRDLVSKVPFLRDASEELIRELIDKLKPAVYTPGDVIIRAGDTGSHMYFIRHGVAEVTSADGATVIDRLEDGDFFGEIALLHSAPRTATVKALDYCDLYTLTKESFDVVVERYPEFAQHMEAVISERFPRTK